jgi:hypothetical protein
MSWRLIKRSRRHNRNWTASISLFTWGLIESTFGTSTQQRSIFTLTQRSVKNGSFLSFKGMLGMLRPKVWTVSPFSSSPDVAACDQVLVLKLVASTRMEMWRTSWRPRSWIKSATRRWPFSSSEAQCLSHGNNRTPIQVKTLKFKSRIQKMIDTSESIYETSWSSTTKSVSLTFCLRKPKARSLPYQCTISKRSNSTIGLT